MLAWLKRMEEEALAPLEREAFSKWLFDQIGDYSTAQEEGLWAAKGAEEVLGAHNIVVVDITYPWGRETRYVIQGIPGLWGYESMKQVEEAEGW